MRIINFFNKKNIQNEIKKKASGRKIIYWYYKQTLTIYI